MTPRLFRATIDGHSRLVDLDHDTARVKPDTGERPASSHTGSTDATNATAADERVPAFTITPFDTLVSRVQESGTPLALDILTVPDSTSNATTTLWTFVDGEVFRVEIEDAERTTRSRRTAGDEALAAPMPATVIKLMAEVGQVVAAGDTLLLLEAMKMEMPIRAPRAARIKAFRCQPGDLVQPGLPLVDLEST